jgi:hypothetical protein
MGLTITPSLKDALRDLYFRETCYQEGWAYVLSKDIAFKEKNTLSLIIGTNKIRVKIHEQIVQELETMSGFFDYLVCKVGKGRHNHDRGSHGGGANDDNQDNKNNSAIMIANPLALCWVKTRNGTTFTEGQLEALDRIMLPLAIFRIRDVLVAPRKIETKWETKSGKDWLDKFDDERDEVESDDDYL